MLSAWNILTLATLAVAGPIRSAQDYARDLRLAARLSVNDANIAEFALYAEYSTSVYCNYDVEAGTAITCGGECDTIESQGATVLGTFDGLWTGIAGLLAVNDAREEIVFSIRGSSNIRNWIANLNFDFEDSDVVDGGKAHDGFQSAWEEMSDGVTAALADAVAAHPGYKIVATGHSLGGAVATLGAAALREAGYSVDIYTYGAPRPGNDVLVDYITAQAGSENRITHIDDPVPRLPPIIFGYRHTSPEYWLSEDIRNGDDYPVADVDVCTGNANVNCNAGTGGLNINAHGYYFGEISSCTLQASSSPFSTQADDSDLEAQVDEWAKEDIEFVKGS